ncbi:hypothetical protein C1H46_005676 [Malus baccata]|uniref:Auxin-responsive protein n=1 Tax=Malus baccata TaxID=106549 RepID=A0A540NCC2_MALBA|nr:hypothetical protein C1H46_005676 [Malus baccata]
MGVRSSKVLSQLIGAPRGDTKRFMVHTTLLHHVEFSELLHRSAEEYGFPNDGVLRIPYEAKDFEEYLMIKRSKPKIYKVEPV